MNTTDPCVRRPARGLSGGLLALILLALHSGVLEAQQQTALTAAVGVAAAEGPLIDGPPAPTAPEVVSRDEAGRATVRAVRAPQPLRIDGRLDESMYESVPPIDGFIQQEPRAGEPETERTQVWVSFDDVNLYVSARCWDTSDPDQWVVSSLQRDGQLTDSENFVVILDTFYDRRNGFYFQTNVAGAMRDQVVTDEGNENESWNTVWQVRTARFDGGWSMEMEIPFKSLRYRAAGPQTWGVNFRRMVRSKNEVTYLTRVPPQYGTPGIYRLSVAGTLVGVETPAQSKNLEIKPYAMSALTTDRTAAVPYSNNLLGDVGADLKYGLSRGLIADFTYNTDFAQVEEDLQQVNLTRFSLFFPEKRDFFLEGQGIFTFGGAGAERGGGGGSSDVPILFFSRRIGLSQGQPVPVIGGGRLTGKAGAFDIGLLNIVTDAKPSAGALETNFSVARLKRGILRQSYVGLIAARRSPTAAGADDNLTIGGDLALVLSRSLTITSYYARTRSPGRSGDQSSHRARLVYSSDRYGLELEQLQVGAAFNPEVGFLRRENFRSNSANVRFSPRPRSSTVIRKFSWEGGFDYVTDAKGEVVQTRKGQAVFRTDLQSGDRTSIDYTRNFEFVERPFGIGPGVVVPVGGYEFDNVAVGYSFGRQRKVSGRLNVNTGSFYGGKRTEAGYSTGRVRVSPHLEFEPGLSVNWVSLPQGTFTTRLASTRILIMPTARMLIGGLLQYNSSSNSFNSNIRLRWEYTSGSELFLVYSDGRTTGGRGFPDVTNRSLALKITRLFRM